MGKAAVVAISLILVVVDVVGAVIDTGTATGGGGVGNGIMSGMKAVDTLCSSPEIQKDLCRETLSPVVQGDANATLKAFVEASFQATIKAAKKALNDSNSLDKDAKDKFDVSSLEVCKKHVGYMVDDLEAAIPKVSEIEVRTKTGHLARELNIALSAVLSYKSTCLEEMDNPKLKEALEGGVLLSTIQLAKNGLAIANGAAQLVDNVDKKPSRRLLDVGKDW